MRRRSLAVLPLLLAVAVPSFAHADPPGVALTLSGPAQADPNVPIAFTGALTALGAVGVPLQPVEVFVDGSAAPAASTQTGPDGAYGVTLTFASALPYTHTLRAVANRGTVLETSSPTLTIAITPPPASKLAINEVDYDQAGTDGAEYVEIYNPTAAPASLDGIALILINGANNLEYARVALSGTLPAHGYALIADPAVPLGGASLFFPFATATNSIQNGAPDGLALFDLSSATMLDALSYEGAVTAAVINGVPGTWNLVEGTPTPVADGETQPGSLSRRPDGADTNNAAADWAFAASTPGGANA